MSCLVAAAQIGSYFGSTPRRPRLGLDQDLCHVGVPGPASRSRVTAASGSSMAAQIEPRHRSCQLLWLSSQWLACQSFKAHDIACCASGSARGVGAGLQDRDVGAGLHDQLPERHVRVAAGELAVRREGVHPHRVGVRVVGSVVVDLLADIASEEVLAAPRLRDVLGQLTTLGRRMDVGVDAPDGDALGCGHPLLRVCQRHRGLPSPFPSTCN